MLLGKELLADPDWRLVEGDLHDISNRVREYDRDARLVRNDETGRLGLARWLNSTALIAGGAYILARECIDWHTGQPLVGEPDPRVLTDQLRTDGHRIRDVRVYHRRRRDARERADQARHDALMEANAEPAERLVHTIGRKDRGIRNFAAIPKGV